MGFFAPAMPRYSNYRGSDVRIPSRDDNSYCAFKKEAPVYTGNNMLGVTIMHKSNLVPIFNEDAAKDAATMRR